MVIQLVIILTYSLSWKQVITFVSMIHTCLACYILSIMSLIIFSFAFRKLMDDTWIYMNCTISISILNLESPLSTLLTLLVFHNHIRFLGSWSLQGEVGLIFFLFTRIIDHYFASSTVALIYWHKAWEWFCFGFLQAVQGIYWKSSPVSGIFLPPDRAIARSW